MESQPIPEEKPEIDPRRKDGQGLDFWADAFLKQGIINQEEHDEFVLKNNSKEKIMEEKGVPQLNHYGLFDSVEEIKEKLLEHQNERFIIRCSLKETGEIKRLIDASLDEICEFAEKLPGGFEQWNVEIKEFVDTKASGTIIVEPSGKTNIETWKGSHYLNTTNVPKYHGEFDPNQFHRSYQWNAPEGAEDLAEFQQYATQALRYVFPHLKPKSDEPIYIEYGVKPNGEVYFIEANDSPFLTGGYKNNS